MPTTLSPMYVKLFEVCPLRPIRNDEDLDRATATISTLVRRGIASLDPDEKDYLTVLGTLVRAYEEEHYPFPDLEGVELLRFLLEHHELSQADLSEQTGIPTTTICEILAGRRTISAKVREALGKRFGLSPSVFV